MTEAGVSDLTFWIAVPLLAAGTFVLRYLLLGLIADRPMTGTLRRALDYVPAAVLPAIAAPLLAYDAAGAVQTDPAKLTAVAAALAVGVATRNVLATIMAGMGSLWLLQALF